MAKSAFTTPLSLITCWSGCRLQMLIISHTKSVPLDLGNWIPFYLIPLRTIYRSTPLLLYSTKLQWFFWKKIKLWEQTVSAFRILCLFQSSIAIETPTNDERKNLSVHHMTVPLKMRENPNEIPTKKYWKKRGEIAFKHFPPKPHTSTLLPLSRKVRNTNLFCGKIRFAKIRVDCQVFQRYYVPTACNSRTIIATTIHHHLRYVLPVWRTSARAKKIAADLQMWTRSENIRCMYDMN